MSISTVSQQFHVDIDDIDNVSGTHIMQNIGVDINSFTSIVGAFTLIIPYMLSYLAIVALM